MSVRPFTKAARGEIVTKVKFFGDAEWPGANDRKYGQQKKDERGEFHSFPRLHILPDIRKMQ